MLGGSLFFLACAPKVPDDLASARVAYEQASAGPAARLVPVEVQNAEQALLAAEDAFDRAPNSYETKDLAYVALRQAEVAEALADAAVQRQHTADAEALYQSTQDAIMRATRERLGSAESELAETLQAAGKTEAELAATATGLSDADVAVHKFDRELASAQESEAQAERKASETAEALSKLAVVKEEARGLVITLSGSVLFRSGESVLLADAPTRLGDVATALVPTNDRGLIIEGHTDSQGTEAYNRELSQRRAEAVRDFLTSRGYDPDRIRAIGMGESRPVDDNATAEGRANNRRVEIVIRPVSTATR